MKDIMKYKDDHGLIHYDSEAPIFYGKIRFHKSACVL